MIHVHIFALLLSGQINFKCIPMMEIQFSQRSINDARIRNNKNNTKKIDIYLKNNIIFGK